MSELEEAAFDELDLLLSEIADYKRKVHAMVNRQFFLIEKALSNAIRIYQLLPDKQMGGSNLNRLEQMIAERKSKINADLIPLFEKLGDQGRLKLVIGFRTSLDRLQSIIDSKPR
ncbi:hypothetical protein SAMN04487898_10384 [Pedobacter sp. ok626]|uniref:hypothetical protein n=1 Tax=Pedobacter sp. ok626 TaxID=1761882 RepID=UPI000885B855|nr:hypothetical protein [Pedobacter sp. ok626]SDJ49573.1 hypothetical protein SAMN04487898_10384 [Pedobacter sp. ok626]